MPEAKTFMEVERGQVGSAKAQGCGMMLDVHAVILISFVALAAAFLAFQMYGRR